MSRQHDELRAMSASGAAIRDHAERVRERVEELEETERRWERLVTLVWDWAWYLEDVQEHGVGWSFVAGQMAMSLYGILEYVCMPGRHLEAGR